MHNGHDGRPGARNIDSQCAQILGQLKHLIAAGDEGQAVLLVQHILGSHVQQRIVAIAESGGGQRSAGQVVDRVLMADHGGQGGSGLGRQQAEVRHEGGKSQLCVDFFFHAVDLAFIDHTGDEAAQHGRGHVVGMAFN